MVFRRRVVGTDGPARALKFFGVVGGQVGTDDVPGGSEVARAKQDISPEVNRVRVMVRDDDRSVPVETKFVLRGRCPTDDVRGIR